MTLEVAREHYIKERPRYVAAGQHVASQLSAITKGAGLTVRTSTRAKAIDSLTKKLIKKSIAAGDSGPTEEVSWYDSIRDKAGVRVVVPYLSNVSTVKELVQANFEIDAIDDKVKDQAYDVFGYAGVIFIFGCRMAH